MDVQWGGDFGVGLEEQGAPRVKLGGFFGGVDGGDAEEIGDVGG